MRIALLTPVFAPAVGGMERFAEDLAGWLATHGHEVTVVTRTRAERPDELRAYDLVRVEAWSDAAPLVRSADVVHVNGLSVRASAAAARSGHRPVVTHAAHQAICPVGIAAGPNGAPCTASGRRPGPCSSCFRSGPTAWLNVRAQRVAATRAATNVCISRYLEARLALPRSTTVYNPVSAEAFDEQHDAERASDLVVFVGRLAQEKGVDVLLRALADVRDARLALVGDGPDRTRLEQLAGELEMSSRVEFRGTQGRAAVLAAFRRAAIACTPTTCEEAFGYTAAEAMAVGTPLVVTPSGALPELVADERGHVAEQSTPAALAEALRSALGDPKESLRRAERAGRFAREHLHIDVTGPAYVELYERAAS